jgi:hypothetical protein
LVGAADGCDPGNTAGQLAGKPVGHRRSVGHPRQVDGRGVDMKCRADVVQHGLEIGDIVDLIGAGPAADTLKAVFSSTRVPGAQIAKEPRSRTTGIRHRETFAIGKSIHATRIVEVPPRAGKLSLRTLVAPAAMDCDDQRNDCFLAIGWREKQIIGTPWPAGHIALRLKLRRAGAGGHQGSENDERDNGTLHVAVSFNCCSPKAMHGGSSSSWLGANVGLLGYHGEGLRHVASVSLFIRFPGQEPAPRSR